LVGSKDKYLSYSLAPIGYCSCPEEPLDFNDILERLENVSFYY